MDTFPFIPNGKVKVSYDWQSKEKTFEDKSTQYVRKRIHAAKTYSFHIGGTDFARLVNFYNSHRGQLDSFYFVYDNNTEECYFSSALNPKIHRENGKAVAYDCEVSLTVIKQTRKYAAPKETDMLPSLRNEVTHSYDWGTDLINFGVATQRRMTREKPKTVLSGEWTGSKANRDKVISIFNSHCRTPASIKYGGKVLKVILPDKLEITDLREQTVIVGFECSVDLEVIGGE